MGIPARSRMVLLAPSQPSTKRPVNVWAVPPAGEARVHLDRGRGERAEGAVQPADLQPRGGSRSAGAGPTRASMQLFQVGLVEHVRLREPVDADLVLAAELGHDAVSGVE